MERGERLGKEEEKKKGRIRKTVNKGKKEKIEAEKHIE